MLQPGDFTFPVRVKLYRKGWLIYKSDATHAGCFLVGFARDEPPGWWGHTNVIKALIVKPIRAREPFWISASSLRPPLLTEKHLPATDCYQKLLKGTLGANYYWGVGWRAGLRQARPAKDDVFRRQKVAISHLTNGYGKFWAKAECWPNLKGRVADQSSCDCCTNNKHLGDS